MQPSQSFTANQNVGFGSSNDSSFRSSHHQLFFLETGTTPLEISKLAHDAENLLSALSLYAELLACPGVLSEQCRSYAEEIQILADRSSVLIQRLAGCRRVVRQANQKVVLPRLIAAYKGLLTRIVRRPIEVSIGPFADQAIAVPAEAVERVLLNLTKNAATATPPSGTIRITIEGGCANEANSQGHVLLTVSDDGVGMTGEKVQALFQSAPLTHPTGRGLGLHIVRDLVEQSGGDLNIQSHPERGTRVSVRWLARRTDAA